MIYLTYNVNFACSSNCQDYLLGQLLLAKQCYDYVSKRIFDEKLPYRAIAVQKVVYHPAREIFPNLNSNSIIQTIRAVCANYKSRKKKPTKALEEKNLSLQLTKNSYSNLTKTSINLSCRKNKREVCSLNGYDKINQLFDKYSTSDPKLGFRNGRLYLSIPFEVEETPPKDDSCLGVYLGCRRIATTSDGVA